MTVPNENPTTGITESGVPSDDLLSMLEASESGSSPDTESAGNPAEDTPEEGGDGTPAPTPAAIAQTPPADPAGSQPATDKGPIPFARHQAALNNARETARQEAETKYQPYFKPFEGMDVRHVAPAAELLRDFQRDPIAAYVRMGRDLQSLGYQLPNTQAAPASPPPPTALDPQLMQADIVSADGKIKTFSEGRVLELLKANGEIIANQLRQELQPVISYTNEAKTHARNTEMARYAKQLEDEVKALPGYNEAGVMAAMATIPVEEVRMLGAAGTLHKAYNLFMRDKVLPGYDAEAERRVRETLQKKVNGSDTINPSLGSGDGKKPNIADGDVTALASYMASQAG